MLIFLSLSGIHEQFDIIVNCSDTCNTEFFNQHLGHIGRQETWQRGPKVDILHTQIQQSQENDDGLLFVPGDIKAIGSLLISSSPNTSLSFRAMTARE